MPIDETLSFNDLLALVNEAQAKLDKIERKVRRYIHPGVVTSTHKLALEVLTICEGRELPAEVRHER